MPSQNQSPINKPEPRGWKRMFSTIRYSVMGLRAAWKYEESFRQQAYVALIALPLSLCIAQSWIEYMLLLGSLVLILIVELLNSSLETIVDRISVEFHELSGRAKDLGSAAAMLTMTMAAIIWGSLLILRVTGY